MRKTLLDEFRACCQTYYQRPRREPHFDAGADVWKVLYRRHARNIVNSHAVRIAAILDATELEVAHGEARDRILAWHNQHR